MYVYHNKSLTCRQGSPTQSGPASWRSSMNERQERRLEGLLRAAEVSPTGGRAGSSPFTLCHPSKSFRREGKPTRRACPWTPTLSLLHLISCCPQQHPQKEPSQSKQVSIREGNALIWDMRHGRRVHDCPHFLMFPCRTMSFMAVTRSPHKIFGVQSGLTQRPLCLQPTQCHD